MDPNLRTLSLAAWMSLPGLDFGTWENLHMKESMAEKNKIQVGLPHQSQSYNSKKSKQFRNSCTKCQELREKSHFTNNDRVSNILLHNNNNNNEVSQSICNCSKISLKFNLTDDKRLGVNEVKSKGTKRYSEAQNQFSRETQSRALVSKVAKYYESYVTHMKLEKYFVNDVVVTSIIPMHWKDTKCKGARWIVVGYALPFIIIVLRLMSYFSNFLAKNFHPERLFPIAAKM